MKTFYSAADIEALASQGIRELAIDDDVVLTAVARETAAQLGLRLVNPAARSVGLPASTPAGAHAQTPDVAKPKGCQHGTLHAAAGDSGGTPTVRSAGPAANGLVDDLIGAVKQLARQG